MFKAKSSLEECNRLTLRKKIQGFISDISLVLDALNITNSFFLIELFELGLYKNQQ